jgi:hypothetical protein
MQFYLVHVDSDAGGVLAGNLTSLEHLEHLEIKSFGAEALEMHIVEHCASLEKPSETTLHQYQYLCLLYNSSFYFQDSYAGPLLR